MNFTPILISVNMVIYNIKNFNNLIEYRTKKPVVQNFGSIRICEQLLGCFHWKIAKRSYP